MIVIYYWIYNTDIWHRHRFIIIYIVEKLFVRINEEEEEIDDKSEISETVDQENEDKVAENDKNR